MIGYLTGTVHRVTGNKILLLTSGGVGYEITAAGSLLANAKTGAEFSADIFTIVREQEITLYGFAHENEKQFFERLISVSGIGPKTAVQMISMPIVPLQNAIEQGDIPFITKVPGIGKKTAERLVVELRGKLDFSAENFANQPISSAQTEATDALKNLGYDAATINSVLKKAPEDADTEALVKFFLSSGS